MSTERDTPQPRSVLQVGPLKPSLAQTLAAQYAAHVLPDDPAARDAFLTTQGREVSAVVTSGRCAVALIGLASRLSATTVRSWVRLTLGTWME